MLVRNDDGLVFLDNQYSLYKEVIKMIFISILAISLWVGGYFMTARIMSTTGALSDDLEKIISPPTWLYYLCGVPVSKEYPKGTMRVVAFRSQICGIFLGLYIAWYLISKPSTYENVAGFGLSILLTFMVTGYIAKHYGLKNKNIKCKYGSHSSYGW